MTEITITEEDIKNGLEGGCFICPGAIATNRVLKPEYQACFGDTYMKIALRATMRYAHKCSCPDIVRNFVQTFDDERNSVQPITFQLDIPKEFLK